MATILVSPSASRKAAVNLGENILLNRKSLDIYYLPYNFLSEIGRRYWSVCVVANPSPCDKNGVTEKEEAAVTKFKKNEIPHSKGIELKGVQSCSVEV